MAAISYDSSIKPLLIVFVLPIAVYCVLVLLLQVCACAFLSYSSAYPAVSARSIFCLSSLCKQVFSLLRATPTL